MGNQQERPGGILTVSNLSKKRSCLRVSQESSEAICQAPDSQQDEDMVRSHVRAWEDGGTETTIPSELVSDVTKMHWLRSRTERTRSLTQTSQVAVRHRAAACVLDTGRQRPWRG